MKTFGQNQGLYSDLVIWENSESQFDIDFFEICFLALFEYSMWVED